MVVLRDENYNIITEMTHSSFFVISKITPIVLINTGVPSVVRLTEGSVNHIIFPTYITYILIASTCFFMFVLIIYFCCKRKYNNNGYIKN